MRLFPSSPSRFSSARELWRRAVGDPTPLIGLILLLVALSHTWHENHDRAAGIDFYQFWLVGRAVDEVGVTNIYSLEGRRELTRIGAGIAAVPGGSRRLSSAAGAREIFENFSTPFLYVCFGWASSGDYDRDYSRFQVVCLALLAGAVVFFGRALGYGPGPTFLMLLAVLLGFRPALSDMLVGNVSRLELGGIALAFGILRSSKPWREMTAGAVLGLLLFFKPNTVLVVVLLLFSWLVGRRWARLLWHGAGLALGSVLAIGLSWVYFGSARPWLDWLAALTRIEAESNLATQSGNFGLVRILMERGLPDLSLVLTAGLSGAAALAIWLGSRRTARAAAGDAVEAQRGAEHEYRTELIIAAVGLAIPLLGFRLAWMHYFVLALPLMACGIRPEPFEGPGWNLARGARRLVGIAGTLLLFGGPLYLLQSQGPPPPALQYSAGTALLLLLALFDLSRRGRAPDASNSS